MKLLDLITDLHNWITDKDFVWWPFSFLRPEKNIAITWGLVFQMASSFSLLGTLMFAGFALVNNIFTFDGLIQILVMTFVFFFLWFALITRTFWNRRARRLLSPK